MVHVTFRHTGSAVAPFSVPQLELHNGRFAEPVRRWWRCKPSRSYRSQERETVVSHVC